MGDLDDLKRQIDETEEEAVRQFVAGICRMSLEI
jgi:hypothetical protein